MKRGILQNQYTSSNLLKIFFADIVCFLVVAILSVGFCYSYFSKKADANGNVTMANVNIDYRKVANNASTSTDVVYGSINGGTVGDITSDTNILPGDTLNIRGYAVNTSNTVDVYILGRLEIITNKDTEVIWYNIKDNVAVYFHKGLFQIGASSIVAGASQAISIDYVIEGARYTSEYVIEDVNFSLHAHQKEYLTTSSDFNEYSEVNGYSHESIYATHYITNRKHSIIKQSDVNVEGLTLNNLQKDSSGAYLINNFKDWFIFKANCTQTNNYCEGMNFKLNAYLDAGGEGFEELDKTIHQFNGNFDGNGYTVSNWWNWNGLFFTMNGNISNVGMEAFLVDSSLINENGWSKFTTNNGMRFMGSIVGMLQGNIENCFAVDALISGDLGLNGTGGIIANSNNNTMVVGALVGGLSQIDLGNAPAVMRNCYVFSIIYHEGISTTMGGMVGLVGDNVQINTSFFSGTLISENVNDCSIGLLVGASEEGQSSINNCATFGLDVEYINGESVVVGHGGQLTGHQVIVNNCILIGNDGGDADTYNIVNRDENGAEFSETISFKNEFESMDIAFYRNKLGWDTGAWVSTWQVYMDYTETSYLMLPRVFFNF